MILCNFLCFYCIGNVIYVVLRMTLSLLLLVLSLNWIWFPLAQVRFAFLHFACPFLVCFIIYTTTDKKGEEVKSIMKGIYSEADKVSNKERPKTTMGGNESLNVKKNVINTVYRETMTGDGLQCACTFLEGKTRIA